MHSTYFKNALINHIFKNLAIANVGDASGLPASATPGNLYISFHTADPTAGDQTTNEANYGGYARKSVVRGSGFTVNGGQAYNAAELIFDTCTSGANTITHVGIGTALSGSGTLLYVHQLSSDAFVVATGIIPSFDPGQLTITYE